MMENLSITDSAGRGAPPPPPAGPQGGPQLAAPQQLPPQMFTTAAQLLDLTDSKGLPLYAPVGGWVVKTRGREGGW